MESVECGIVDVEPRSSLPETRLETRLLRVPHKNGILVVRYPAFGPNSYSSNLESMGKRYFHSTRFPDISFRPATTPESVSASAYKFGKIAKKEIFNPNCLQVGPIVRTSEGVFANTKEVDESVLKFAYTEYETFKNGFQDSRDFSESGLARLLEHTCESSAPNLREISSAENYPNGVKVFGFDSVKEPVLRVAGLYSYGSGLRVDGGLGDGGGYAFGVRSTDALGVVEKN
ncbi:hypothetical protein J4205_02785 [Candidatus Pacearchaeota archaeon]|nr:hypothetical protein [Candidatus Pacearchaeota archaeon]